MTGKEPPAAALVGLQLSCVLGTPEWSAAAAEAPTGSSTSSGCGAQPPMLATRGPANVKAHPRSGTHMPMLASHEKASNQTSKQAKKNNRQTHMPMLARYSAPVEETEGSRRKAASVSGSGFSSNFITLPEVVCVGGEGGGGSGGEAEGEGEGGGA